MTVTGEVIRCFFDATAEILINVRAAPNGWSVSAIDTRFDRHLKTTLFASRERAERYAEHLAQKLGARRVAHSFPVRADPRPDPATIRYDQE